MERLQKAVSKPHSSAPQRKRVAADAATEGAAIPEFLSFSGWFSLSSAGVVRLS
jgi:hypothetical protein